MMSLHWSSKLEELGLKQSVSLPVGLSGQTGEVGYAADKTGISRQNVSFWGSNDHLLHDVRLFLHRGDQNV